MKDRHKGLILCIFISLIFLSVVYNNIFFHPNKFLLNETGDGNYFIYAWHIKHDTSYTHFGGLSYPFGETIAMDSMHNFSTIVKLVAEIFPGIEKFSIGILNFLMFSSLLFGALFLFYIDICPIHICLFLWQMP